MDINRLSSGEKIVLGSSALLVVLSFIPLWASYSVAGFSESYGAWSGAYGFFVKLALIMGILALVVTGLRAAGTQLPDLPVSLGLLYVGIGGVATLGLLIGVLTGPNDGGLGGAFAAAAGLDISRGILLFVGLVLAAAIAYGGYMHMQSETSGSGLGDTLPPPPPPA